MKLLDIARRIIYKAYSKRKANTRPINPLTSTKLNPIKLHLIKVFDKTGFLLIEINKKLKISPTPIPTPAKDTRGILDAKYLNPNNIMDRYWEQHKNLRYGINKAKQII